jgi:hypothetical protein
LYRYLFEFIWFITLSFGFLNSLKKMDQKKLLIENADIKQIVEKNQEIIEAMKKLNQLLDHEFISKSENKQKTITKKHDRLQGEG